MEFNSSRPIYLQIADFICEKILSDDWKDSDRIPSVRDLAISIEVNPNTVMRTFTFLQEKGIISNQRGVGYFVAVNGRELAKVYKTDQFIKVDLDQIFRTMDLLGIEITDLEKFYLAYKRKLRGNNEAD
ncbi:MAG: GntR family transcriptional regulator [Ignavibacteriales bacterium]